MPTLFFGEHCLFGPVLIDPPTGDAAMRLWHAVTAWAEFPHLHELQRPKTAADHQAIADSSALPRGPRPVVSINRGEVAEFPTS